MDYYVYIIKFESELHAVGSIRRTFGGIDGAPTPTVEEVRKLLKDVQEKGHAFFGVFGSEQAAQDAAAVLSISAAAGIECQISTESLPDVDPEPDDEDDIDISLEGAKAALVVMQQTDGHPLKAALQIQALGRATTQPVFTEALALLLESFPWLEGIMKEHDLL